MDEVYSFNFITIFWDENTNKNRESKFLLFISGGDIVLVNKLAEKEDRHALYPVKEVQALYIIKLQYQALEEEIAKLKKENWHLKQLLLRNDKWSLNSL